MKNKTVIAKKLVKISKLLILSMAQTRGVFADRLREYLTGALGEYYKVVIAKNNGQSKWTEHWQTEVESLLSRFSIALAAEIRGFSDRRKVAISVIDRLKLQETRYQGIAYRQLTSRYFPGDKLKFMVGPEDSTKFWSKATHVLNEVLDSRGRIREDFDALASSEAQSE